jgi:hypothetical protein
MVFRITKNTVDPWEVYHSRYPIERIGDIYFLEAILCASEETSGRPHGLLDSFMKDRETRSTQEAFVH